MDFVRVVLTVGHPRRPRANAIWCLTMLKLAPEVLTKVAQATRCPAQRLVLANLISRL